MITRTSMPFEIWVFFGVAAVLADGMGGLSLGAMAAEVVTSNVADYISRNYKGYDERSILYEALAHADKELRNVSMAYKSNMGAAVTAVIVHDHYLYCTWQGNVRVYVRNGNTTTLITEDHIAHIGYGRTALTRCIKGAGLREGIPCKFQSIAASSDFNSVTSSFFHCLLTTYHNYGIPLS